MNCRRRKGKRKKRIIRRSDTVCYLSVMFLMFVNIPVFIVGRMALARVVLTCVLVRCGLLTVSLLGLGCAFVHTLFLSVRFVRFAPRSRALAGVAHAGF